MRLAATLLIAILGAVFQSSAPPDPDDLLAQLSKIQLDKKQIYTIRDVTIRRDVFTLAFNRGTIAFLEPVNGKVTGAVFIGSGEAVAIPPDAVEKQQMFKFTGSPILNEPFETAVFRFSDDTYQELTKEMSQHSSEEVTAQDRAQFDAWDASQAGRSNVLNLRLLTDFVENPGKPLFMGDLNNDRRGWFHIVFDMRSEEEVSVYQIREIAGIAVADVWASFNQRSEARNPEAVAHERKSPVDVVSYEIEANAGPEKNLDAKVTMRAKARVNDARVLSFELAPSLGLTSIEVGEGEPVKYYQFPNQKNITAVLPRSLKANQDVTLKFGYAGELSAQGPWYPWQHQDNIPAVSSTLPIADNTFAPSFNYSGRRLTLASYRDQWLIEGLTRYVPLVTAENNETRAAELRAVLTSLRDELKPAEGAGPIWIGPRVVSTITPDAYRTVYAKGVWVIHMVRMMLRQNGPDPDSRFLAMLQEFVQTYDGRAASTWDFRKIAEKYAGKKLDWFFDQWVFATGIPAYALEYKVETSGNDFIIDGKITQTGVADGFMMPVPIYADGDYLGTVEVGESEERFKFHSSRMPERLVIDPDMTILTAIAP